MTMIAEDNQSPDQIIRRLDEHLARCPPADFIFGRISEASRQIACVIRLIAQAERLKGKAKTPPNAGELEKMDKRD